MMLSLFTASPTFSMTEDKIYAEYVRGVENEAEMSATVEELAEGSWRWMTASEAQAADGRPAPMIQLLTKQDADEMDKIFKDVVEGEENFFMVADTDWSESYRIYGNHLKAMVKRRYMHALPEDDNARKVHIGIMRKVEWVMMKHPKRTIPSYPILTKSVLPTIADQLKKVEPSITEVS